MFLNKLWHAILLCCISMYTILQLEWIICYNGEEINKHIYKYNDETINNGENVQIASIMNFIAMISLLVYLLRIIYYSNLRDKCNIVLLIWFLIWYTIGIIFTTMAFITNCYYATPSCYHITTPLYGIIIFNLHIIFLLILSSLIYCITITFELCYNKKSNRYEDYLAI